MDDHDAGAVGWACGVLAGNALRRIDELALRLLAETGMQIADEQLLGLMAEAGFEVTRAEQRVRFPAHLVAEYLACVPRSYTIGGRTPADDLELGPGVLYVRPQSGCPNVVDMATGQARPACLADAVAMARLNEALPNIHVAASLIYPDDVPPEDRDVALLAALMEHTRKHIYIQPYEAAGAVRMIEMAGVVAGSAAEVATRPPFSLILAPTSPLILAPNECAILRLAASRRIPCFFGSTPQRGATGPVTVAGQLMLMHAENLACLVTAQVIQPGTPVTYGIRPASLDMKTANSVWAGAEWSQATAAAVQLARLHGLITDVVGFPSDSKALDEQAGLEKGFTAGFLALCCEGIMAGAGFVETIMSGSFEQLVIDDDISGMIGRVRRGIAMDEDRLAYDLVSRLGPGAHFLTERHTIRYMRDETFYPSVLNRDNRSGWEAAGASDAVQAARQRANQLIAAHHLGPLDPEVRRELDRIASPHKN